MSDALGAAGTGLGPDAQALAVPYMYSLYFKPPICGKGSVSYGGPAAAFSERVEPRA